MNRNEFMEQLRRLLYDIPVKDREEAIEYYESYFDDAGEENEEAVIRELGSPGRVAAEIRAGLNPDLNAGEYTDTGYHNSDVEMGEDEALAPVKHKRSGKSSDGMDDGVKKLLLIGMIVISFPLWGTIFGTAFSILMGLIGIMLSLLIGTLVGGIAIGVCSIVLAVIGILHMVTSLPLGIAMLGVGMLFLALGILLLISFGWLVSKVIPAAVRFVTDFIQRILRRVRREDVE